MTPQPPATNLLTPRQIVARGLCSPQEMDHLLQLFREQVVDLERDFPDAAFRFDADDILQVEAGEAEAAEIDSLLQETTTAFIPFRITART